MATEREKEREMELEGAMYTNCLLLGLDPSIIGVVGEGNGAPRVGQFRHSNPKLGEQLLYFILCSLRGPIQSAKDFDKVWPICDSSQTRDFRKIVQGIITELESQGALPRSNSRLSSLATCCGQRFVELLWQLSLHALREVHRRMFLADVASNPLPDPLTEVSYMHAASLLPVTKARITLERRRFLKNANAAVNRQAAWSSLAQEMTAEFRGLCAEEAYLQQELEKLQDLRNKEKLEGELWDERVSSSLGQNSHLVSKATRLWESLLSRKGQHEVLASGPIEDLIAHREHRYRISGSSLLAAMDQSSHVPYPDVLSVQPDDLASAHADDMDQIDGSYTNANKEKSKTTLLDSAHFQVHDEALSRVDDRIGRAQPIVDVAEILRRWTHALQRIHKQSLHLAKANDGEGPELLRCASDSATSGHAESLTATLSEHRQHLASIQVLVSQLKEAVPTMQESISELTEEVRSISSVIPIAKHDGRSAAPIQAQSSGRPMETSADAVEVTSKLSSVQLDKVSTSPPLKLPHLFSLTPNSSGKGANAQKRPVIPSQTNLLENFSERKSMDQPLSSGHLDNSSQDIDGSYVQNLRRSVREAALSMQSGNLESSQNNNDDSSGHFFVPLSKNGFPRMGPETDIVLNRSKHQFASPLDAFVANNSPDLTSDRFIRTSNEQRTFFSMEDPQDQVFSPPLQLETSLLSDTYEDLLAPLSEIDAALMER